MNLPTMLPTRKAQSGLTIVETLVAIVLTLALIAGLIQMLAGVQLNTRTQNNRSSMDDDARFAVEYLSRAGQRAGFKLDPISINEQIFPAVANTFPSGAVVFGTDTSVSLRFQGHPDGQMMDCLNNAADQNGVYVEQWALSAAGQLQCNISRPSGTTNTEPLLNNIEDINIQYGIDTDGDQFPNAYVSAAGVGGNWNSVRSIVIGLRVVSTNNFLADKPQAYMNFQGQNVTPTDRRLRRNVFTTIALRNNLP